MVMGIGRGDSSRRVVGLKPVRIAEFEAACLMMSDLMNGRPVEWNGKELELSGPRAARRSRCTSPATGRARWASRAGCPTA